MNEDQERKKENPRDDDNPTSKLSPKPIYALPSPTSHQNAHDPIKVKNLSKQFVCIFGLLGRALDTLTAGSMHVIVLIQTVSATRSASLLLRINVLKDNIVNHGVWAKLGQVSGRENSLKEGNLLGSVEVVVGELDIKVNVEVTHVVVAVGRHSLSANLLHSAYDHKYSNKNKSEISDLPGLITSPGRMET